MLIGFCRKLWRHRITCDVEAQVEATCPMTWRFFFFFVVVDIVVVVILFFIGSTGLFCGVSFGARAKMAPPIQKKRKKRLAPSWTRSLFFCFSFVCFFFAISFLLKKKRTHTATHTFVRLGFVSGSLLLLLLLLFLEVLNWWNAFAGDRGDFDGRRRGFWNELRVDFADYTCFHGTLIIIIFHSHSLAFLSRSYCDHEVPSFP